MYREIASRVVEYAVYFREDGVQGEELLAILDALESDMAQMEQQATSTARKELEAIRWIVDGAYKMVRSTYQIEKGGLF